MGVPLGDCDPLCLSLLPLFMAEVTKSIIGRRNTGIQGWYYLTVLLKSLKTLKNTSGFKHPIIKKQAAPLDAQRTNDEPSQR